MLYGASSQRDTAVAGIGEVSCYAPMKREAAENNSEETNLKSMQCI